MSILANPIYDWLYLQEKQTRGSWRKDCINTGFEHNINFHKVSSILIGNDY